MPHNHTNISSDFVETLKHSTVLQIQNLPLHRKTLERTKRDIAEAAMLAGAESTKLA